MPISPNPSDRRPSQDTRAPGGPRLLLRTYHWPTFLMPMFVFMLVGSLEPTPETLGGATIGLAIPYNYYPALYTLKIALTVLAIVLVWPGYGEFPFRIGRSAWVIGVLGVVIWVGLCRLNLEQGLLAPLLKPVGLDRLVGPGTRSEFNPFQELADQPAWAWAFFAIRLFGLAAVVPLIEEFFLRGFVMRLAIDNRWWEVPMGKVNTASVLVATLLPMAMHPAELLAAGVWFTMITWMYARTRNIWDCVAAHATTNLLLGVYVAATGDWRLM